MKMGLTTCGSRMFMVDRHLEKDFRGPNTGASMKSKLLLFFIGGLLSLSNLAFAGVYMGTSADAPSPQTHNTVSARTPVAIPFTDIAPSDVNCQPFVGRGPMPAIPCPVVPVAPVISDVFIAEVHTGSLKRNIERIVRDAGWGTPVWKMNYDYNWRGDVTITGNDVQSVLSKLLEPYPLQAVFYNANHVVAVMPRRNT